ncbi:MAG: methyltransferase domain-containing protein [Arcobacteraceae bacterium]
MKTFTDETTYEIYESLKNSIEKIKFNEVIYFALPNFDSKDNITLQDLPIKGYKAVTNLAETLFCKMLTPEILLNNNIKIGFKKLDTTNSFHSSAEQTPEKYGKSSLFATLNKNSEPTFVVPYIHALKRVELEKKYRVLNLGINSGDEFEIISEVFKHIDNIEFIGIDYCQSAINEAKKRFEHKKNFTFYAHDINTLEELTLGKFDLIITIGTLQSSNLDFKLTFMSLIQNYLERTGSLILGFPNCRWVDGEMIYGAKMPNYSFSEMTLLYKDVYFCKKYLQQKKFKVTLTGKEYVFLTANALK